MTGPQPGDEEFPEPACFPAPHRHAPAVPGVEVANNADPARIGCPQCKGNPLDALVDDGMCAELLITCKMVALDEEVDVELAENGGETVDVVEFALDCATRYAQQVAKRLPPIGDGGHEQAIRVDPDTLGGNIACGGLDNCHLLRRGQHCPHADPAIALVHSKKREGVVVAGTDDGFDLRVKLLPHARSSPSWPESRESL